MERILLLLLFLFPYIFSVKIDIIQHIREAEKSAQPFNQCSFKTCYGVNCTNYTCEQGNCIQVVPIGTVCSELVVCESGTECVNDICVRPIDSGCPCQDNSTCMPSNLYCAGDYRCGVNRTVGSLCDQDKYCHTNTCNQYQCTCRSWNDTCTTDDDCCTEYCAPEGKCQNRVWTNAGLQCAHDDDCISGLCMDGGICVRYFSTPLGGPCKTTLGTECVPGLTCVDGACSPPAPNCSSSCGMFGDCVCTDPVGLTQECKQVLDYSCVQDTYNAYSDCLEQCLSGNSINPDGCNFNCYEPFADFICCLKISPNPVIQTHYAHANCTSKAVCQLQPCCTPGGCTNFEIEACIPPPSLLSESFLLKPFFLLYIIVFVLL